MLSGTNDDWDRSDAEEENSWLNVSELDPGSTYELRIVAVTDLEHETRSQVKGILVGTITGEPHRYIHYMIIYLSK